MGELGSKMRNLPKMFIKQRACHDKKRPNVNKQRPCKALQRTQTDKQHPNMDKQRLHKGKQRTVPRKQHHHTSKKRTFCPIPSPG